MAPTPQIRTTQTRDILLNYWNNNIYYRDCEMNAPSKREWHFIIIAYEEVMNPLQRVVAGGGGDGDMRNPIMHWGPFQWTDSPIKFYYCNSINVHWSTSRLIIIMLHFFHPQNCTHWFFRPHKFTHCWLNYIINPRASARGERESQLVVNYLFICQINTLKLTIVEYCYYDDDE